MLVEPMTRFTRGGDQNFQKAGSKLWNERPFIIYTYKSFVIGMVVKLSDMLAAFVCLLSYLIHNSIGYLPAQVCTLCISFHLFICSFQFLSHITWSECLYKPIWHITYSYLWHGNHNLNKVYILNLN